MLASVATVASVASVARRARAQLVLGLGAWVSAGPAGSSGGSARGQAECDERR